MTPLEESLAFSKQRAETMARLLDTVEAWAQTWAADPRPPVAERGKDLLYLLDHQMEPPSRRRWP